MPRHSQASYLLFTGPTRLSVSTEVQGETIHPLRLGSDECPCVAALTERETNMYRYTHAHTPQRQNEC